MPNFNPNWRDNFWKTVTAQCSGCGRDITVPKSHINRGLFMWCEECRPSRKRERDRAYYHRKQKAARKEARRKAREAKRDRL